MSKKTRALNKEIVQILLCQLQFKKYGNLMDIKKITTEPNSDTFLQTFQ